jgi:hypothetical protein
MAIIGNKPELECRCEFGKVDNEMREMIEENLKPGDDLERALAPYKKRDNNTRTGHYWGCPTDILAYEPGEFYCHCVRTHANAFLIPKSNGMLVTGPMNPEDPNYDKFKDSSGITGVYRKK